MINIGFDMDGVLVDFMAPICKEFKIKKSKCTNYKLEELFPNKAEEITSFYTKKGYFSDLLPYPGAIDFIKKLQKIDNIKIWLVSRPSIDGPETWSDKIIWINKYLPQLLPTTILVQDKSIIDLDIFIEDDPNNLIKNKAKYKILMYQPWNKNNKEFEKVRNYFDLYKKIEKIIHQEIK